MQTVKRKSKLYMRVRPRTFYMDIVNMPDPTVFGVTINYYNFDDIPLYLTIEGSGVGYTFPDPIQLGGLGAGLNAFRNLDEWFSRAKPAAETTEAVTLTLKGYTDAAYTNLKHTFSRNVTIVFIKSDDVSYTVDYLNNFDDGTVQGWAVVDLYNNKAGYPKIGVATDYVLSPPYSLKSLGQSSSMAYALGFRVYKSFVTPDKTNIYAIIDLRLGATATTTYINALRLLIDAMILNHHGGYWAEWTEPRSYNYLPKDKWIRMVVPLPKNVTIEVRVDTQWTQDTLPRDAILWIDDFKIISK